ncbi:hypothetical protein KR200_001506, partial [Drosophila serrata]
LGEVLKMNLLLWILIFVHFSFGILAENNRPDPRIVGGVPADIAKVPYIVSIQLYGIHHCGGSIIDNRTILTAAHCLAQVPRILLRVKAGGERRDSKDGQIYQISDMYYHEKWTTKTMDYDIGVIRLKTALTFSKKIKAIKINPKKVADGQYTTIAGWGFKSVNGPPSDELRYARVPVVNQAVCKKLLGETVTDRMMCAGYLKGGTDACQMDSGGPLVWREELVGIVSWGVGCALADKPGVYTRLEALHPWINMALKKL